MSELKKITSVNGTFYLFNDIPHEQRNTNGIASGQSVLMSIYEPDPFYFTEDVQLIRYADIAITENASSKEEKFFEYVKQNSPVAYKKKIVDDYEISDYIHYAPQLKFKHNLVDGVLTIEGEIKDRNSKFPIQNPYIYVGNPKDEVELDEQYHFKYVVEGINEISDELKIPFVLGTSKAEYGRSFNMKNFEGRLLTPSEISSVKAKIKK
jgi:hypothetical protein